MLHCRDRVGGKQGPASISLGEVIKVVKNKLKKLQRI